jgi:hypothetical protein
VRRLRNVLVAVLAFAGGVAVSHALARLDVRPQAAPPPVTDPANELTLVAATPDGAHVYRLVGPKLVVPVVVVVGPTGQVAIR